MKKILRPVIKLNNSPIMKISLQEIEAIRHAHSICKSKEWSGMLMMNIDGNLKNIDDLIVDVKGFYICDVGSVHHTAFDMTDHMSAFDIFPQWDFENAKWDGITNFSGPKVGLIHTHHNMQAYFSSIDLEELDENVQNYGLYISLIVNQEGNYAAKGAFVSKVKTTQELSSEFYDIHNKNIINEQEYLCIFDFILEFQTENWFIDRLEELEIINAKKALIKSLPPDYKFPTKKSYNLPPVKDYKPKTTNYTKQYIEGYGYFYIDHVSGIVTNTFGQTVAEEVYNHMIDTLYLDKD